MNCEFLTAFTLLWALSSKVSAHGGVVARLNGSIIQVVNSEVHTEWRDYCHYYSQSSSELRRLAMVLCESLGYDRYRTYSTRSYLSAQQRNHLLYELHCNGKEKSLTECSLSYNTYTSCRYYYYVYCYTCITGHVRLRSGIIPQQGYLEVCDNGLWSRPCAPSYLWTNKNTVVVCRQLRFPITEASFSTVQGYVLQNSGYQTFNNYYRCIGNETRLTNCLRYTWSNCLHNNQWQYITIHCKGDPVSRCTPGTIRLYKGKDKYEGRLQICNNWIWEGVSFRYWHYYDAQVACKQLSLFNSSLDTKITWTFVTLVGLSSFRGLHCNGAETRLQYCQYSIDYNDAYLVYLRCQPAYISRTSCSSGEVRLVGSSLANEGRVEYCYKGIWGPICRSGWGRQETAVVCAQLGYQSENSTVVNSGKYGDGNSPFILSSLNCRQESSLIDCQHPYTIGYHTCSSLQGNAAAVHCEIDVCNHGEMRLFGGYGVYEGAPEVCINGKWSYGCYTDWTNSTSTYFCKKLLQHNSIRAVQSSWDSYYKRYPAAQITLNNVSCNQPSAMSTFMDDCTYVARNDTCSPIWVGCFESSCTNGTLRLSNTNSVNEGGIVEVCLNGIWGSITIRAWRISEAKTVCRELSQPWERSLTASSNKMFPFLLSGIYCSSSNIHSILDCTFTYSSYNSIRNRYDVRYNAAAVVCKGNTNPMCANGDFRLLNSTNSSTTIRGEVEVCNNRQWQKVCYWNKFVPALICKKLLGHPRGAFWRYSDGQYRIYQGFSCTCSNTAQQLSSCNIYSGRYCNGYSNLGITCQDILYRVTVSSSTEAHSYELGSTANFSCAVSPELTGLQQSDVVSYSWTLNMRGLGSYTSSITGSNISVFLDGGFMSGYIYCIVYINGAYFMSGNHFIRIEDVVQRKSVEKVNEDLHLSVNTTNVTLFEEIMEGLFWYYNGYPAVTASSNNYIVDERNKTLVARSFDSGIFEVKYEGFLVVPYNKLCEKSLLEVVNNYPAFKSVRIYPNQQDQKEQRNLMSVSTNKGTSSNVYFTVNEKIYMTVAVDFPYMKNSYFGSQYYVRIYHNGVHHVLYSILNDGYWKLNTSISSGNYINSGIYEIYLYLSFSQDFREDCSLYYQVIRSNKFRIYQIILESKKIHLIYYENATVIFSAEKMELYSRETFMLTCNGSIHFPSFSRLSISKANVSLIASQKKYIQISIINPKKYDFGVYQCTMYADKTEFTRTLFIKNKVDFTVQLNFKNANYTCMEKKELQEMCINGLIQVLIHLCKCNLTRSDFSSSLLTCKDRNSVTGFINTTLTYSSPSGDEIAMTIAQRLFLETLSSSSKLEMGNNIVIESVIINSNEPLKDISAESSSTIGIGIGSFVGGAILAMICLGIIFKFYILRQRKSLSQLVQTSHKKEVKYSTNPRRIKDNSKVIDNNNGEEEVIEKHIKKQLPEFKDREGNQDQPTYECVEHMENLGYDCVKYTKN